MRRLRPLTALLFICIAVCGTYAKWNPLHNNGGSVETSTNKAGGPRWSSNTSTEPRRKSHRRSSDDSGDDESASRSGERSSTSAPATTTVTAATTEKPSRRHESGRSSESRRTNDDDDDDRRRQHYHHQQHRSDDRRRAPSSEHRDDDRDESRKDESRKDESRKDESRKDESRKDESRKDESRKDTSAPKEPAVTNHHEHHAKRSSDRSESSSRERRASIATTIVTSTTTTTTTEEPIKKVKIEWLPLVEKRRAGARSSDASFGAFEKSNRVEVEDDDKLQKVSPPQRDAEVDSIGKLPAPQPIIEHVERTGPGWHEEEYFFDTSLAQPYDVVTPGGDDDGSLSLDTDDRSARRRSIFGRRHSGASEETYLVEARRRRRRQQQQQLVRRRKQLESAGGAGLATRIDRASEEIWREKASPRYDRGGNPFVRQQSRQPDYRVNSYRAFETNRKFSPDHKHRRRHHHHHHHRHHRQYDSRGRGYGNVGDVYSPHAIDLGADIVVRSTRADRRKGRARTHGNPTTVLLRQSEAKNDPYLLYEDDQDEGWAPAQKHHSNHRQSTRHHNGHRLYGDGRRGAGGLPPSTCYTSSGRHLCHGCEVSAGHSAFFLGRDLKLDVYNGTIPPKSLSCFCESGTQFTYRALNPDYDIDDIQRVQNLVVGRYFCERPESLCVETSEGKLYRGNPNQPLFLTPVPYCHHNGKCRMYLTITPRKNPVPPPLFTSVVAAPNDEINHSLTLVGSRVSESFADEALVQPDGQHVRFKFSEFPYQSIIGADCGSCRTKIQYCDLRIRADYAAVAK